MAVLPPLRNSYWVIPGQLLAGEHPAGSTTERTRERLKRPAIEVRHSLYDCIDGFELLRLKVWTIKPFGRSAMRPLCELAACNEK